LVSSAIFGLMPQISPPLVRGITNRGGKPSRLIFTVNRIKCQAMNVDSSRESMC